MPTIILLLGLSLLSAFPAGIDQPKVLDPRLTLELFAAEPDIVTPTGIIVEPSGRVLAIESNTHFRPKGYKGPTTDRIRAFEDTDHDGKADRIATVFEGTSMTMGLAVHPSGALYVAARYEVFRLKRNDDGTYGGRAQIARLDTPGDYPHNGLSGFAIDFAGNLYFGLGENLGAPYKLIGSDGTTLAGGGEGGNVYRCDPDGKGLTRVATGFWNPFHLAIDAFGRLFAVDNDPDSRPPCRLLHVVDAGDYGYRFRNGRRGLHPFTAWNGELPGTLPMAAGTGEAPSGIVAYESDNLPDDYVGNILGTSWGDHRIERFRLNERGASLRSTAEPIVTGGENFRPVGIALAPDGSLFISDWVDKSYEVHGKGRIWHLRATKPSARKTPTDDADAITHKDRGIREAAARRLAAAGAAGAKDLAKVLESSPSIRARAVVLQALASTGAPAASSALTDGFAEIRALAVRLLSKDQLSRLEAIASKDPSPSVRAEALRRLSRPEDRTLLLRVLEDPDPFLALAACEGLKACTTSSDLLALAQQGPPARRLGILLLLRESTDPAARTAIPALLDDPDPAIRFATIQWVGEQRLGQFRSRVAKNLTSGSITRPIFEATLASLQLFDDGRRFGAQEFSGEELVASMLRTPGAFPLVRRRCLRSLRPDHPDLTLARLTGFLGDGDPELALEAVRTLRENPDPGRTAVLQGLAKSATAAPALRAEAIVGLSGDEPATRDLLASIVTDPQSDPVVQRESLRSLTGSSLTANQRERILRLADGQSSTAEIARRILEPTAARPSVSSEELQGWLKKLEGPGDPAEGQRIFFHPKGPGCYRCHAVDGRGGLIGPDLTTTARTLTPERLVESIVRPGKEVAPQFVQWTIAKTDGTVLTGQLLRDEPDGTQIYANSRGETFSVKPSDVDDRRASSGSIMPDNLPTTMTAQEFRDLLAFLRKPD